jgi:hypothetical protein
MPLVKSSRMQSQRSRHAGPGLALGEPLSHNQRRVDDVRYSLGAGEKFLEAGLASAALQAFIAFPLSLSDGTLQGLAGGLGNGLGQTVGFRVLTFRLMASLPLTVPTSKVPISITPNSFYDERGLPK